MKHSRFDSRIFLTTALPRMIVQFGGFITEERSLQQLLPLDHHHGIKDKSFIFFRFSLVIIQFYFQFERHASIWRTNRSSPTHFDKLTKVIWKIWYIYTYYVTKSKREEEEKCCKLIVQQTKHWWNDILQFSSNSSCIIRISLDEPKKTFSKVFESLNFSIDLETLDRFASLESLHRLFKV